LNADADWNRDGEVTSTDVAAFGSTHHAGAIPAGLVAPRTSELTVGFCGYRFNPELGAYTVRFRHYDPTPGMARWLERDPAGYVDGPRYVDGPSLYAYSVDATSGERIGAVVEHTHASLFVGTIFEITLDPGTPGGTGRTTISATGEHPFLVVAAGPQSPALDLRADPDAVPLVEPVETQSGRWVPAKDLAAGDTVRTMSAEGVAGTATVCRIRAREAVELVYNLTVSGTSRYLVGECGVVVHNKAASRLQRVKVRNIDPGETQLNLDKLAEHIEKYRDDLNFPPIEVLQVGPNSFEILGGRTRWQRAMNRGPDTEVPIDIINYPNKWSGCR
jgi:RHS repeat-associated protein